MTLLRTSTLLLLVLMAPIAALAADPPAQVKPPSATDPAAAPQPKEVDLPYGAGYEARHRRGQAGEQTAQEQAGARAETKSATRERDRTESRASATDARPARDTTDRSQATRESRREARGHWGQHGPVRR